MATASLVAPTLQVEVAIKSLVIAQVPVKMVEQLLVMKAGFSLLVETVVAI